MQVQTELGDIEVSAETYNTLHARDDAANVTAEVERIVRCAMQAAMEDNSVARRIAIASVAAESIRQATGNRRWL